MKYLTSASLIILTRFIRCYPKSGDCHLRFATMAIPGPRFPDHAGIAIYALLRWRSPARFLIVQDCHLRFATMAIPGPLPGSCRIAISPLATMAIPGPLPGSCRDCHLRFATMAIPGPLPGSCRDCHLRYATMAIPGPLPGSCRDCHLRFATMAIPGREPQTEKAGPAIAGSALFFFTLHGASSVSHSKNKADRLRRASLFCLGGRWDSNPRPSEPQSDVSNQLNYIHRIRSAK